MVSMQNLLSMSPKVMDELQKLNGIKDGKTMAKLITKDVDNHLRNIWIPKIIKAMEATKHLGYVSHIIGAIEAERINLVSTKEVEMHEILVGLTLSLKAIADAMGDLKTYAYFKVSKLTDAEKLLEINIPSALEKGDPIAVKAEFIRYVEALKEILFEGYKYLNKYSTEIQNAG